MSSKDMNRVRDVMIRKETHLTCRSSRCLSRRSRRMFPGGRISLQFPREPAASALDRWCIASWWFPRISRAATQLITFPTSISLEPAALEWTSGVEKRKVVNNDKKAELCAHKNGEKKMFWLFFSMLIIDRSFLCLVNWYVELFFLVAPRQHVDITEHSNPLLNMKH